MKKVLSLLLAGSLMAGLAASPLKLSVQAMEVSAENSEGGKTEPLSKSQSDEKMEEIRYQPADVIVETEEGLVESIPASSLTTEEDGSIIIDETTFPDQVFRTAVLKALGLNEGDTASEKNLQKYISISIDNSSSAENEKLTSLAGIEYLQNLQSLTCTNGNLAEADLSANSKLSRINIANQPLTSITFPEASKNNIKTATIASTQAESLDFSSCEMMENLTVKKNSALVSLVLPESEKLKSLNFSETQVSSLNLSSFPNLSSLDCSKTPVTNLDLQTVPALTSLFCGDCQISSLNLAGLNNLTTLSCGNNPLTDLVLDQCTALQKLLCSSCSLSALDLAGFSELQKVSCSLNRELKTIDLSNCPALTELSAVMCSLESIQLDDSDHISTLNVYKNQLSELDLSGKTMLENLDCSSNNLTSLDLSDCQNLKKFYGYSNELESLILEALPMINQITISQTKLSSLDLSGYSTLTSITAYGNPQMSEIRLPQQASLDELTIYRNALTSLDLSVLAGATEIDCSNNKIASLDVPCLPSLESLDCSENVITDLNIDPENLNLKTVDCSQNRLSQLDLSSSVTNLNASFQHPAITNPDHYQINWFDGLPVEGAVSDVKGAIYDSESYTLRDFDGETISYTYQCSPSTTMTVTPKWYIDETTRVELSDRYPLLNGEAKPKPAVWVYGKQLVRNKDYYCTYIDNTQAGTARINIVGFGNCKGHVTYDFEIFELDYSILEILTETYPLESLSELNLDENIEIAFQNATTMLSERSAASQEQIDEYARAYHSELLKLRYTPDPDRLLQI